VKIATRCAWPDERTLVFKVCCYETPFIRTMTVRFDGDGIQLHWKDNVGFGPTEGPTLTGTG